MSEPKKDKLKSVGGISSLENEQDEYGRNNKDDISVLQNIVSRMGDQGVSIKFQGETAIITLTTYTTGQAADEKDDFEDTHRQIKSKVQEVFKDKTGRSISLKEVDEDFDTENAYTAFKQTLVKYSKIYTY